MAGGLGPRRVLERAPTGSGFWWVCACASVARTLAVFSATLKVSYACCCSHCVAGGGHLHALAAEAECQGAACHADAHHYHTGTRCGACDDLIHALPMPAKGACAQQSTQGQHAAQLSCSAVQALGLLAQGQQKTGLAVGTVVSAALLLLDIKRAYDVGRRHSAHPCLYILVLPLCPSLAVMSHHWFDILHAARGNRCTRSSSTFGSPLRLFACMQALEGCYT